MPSPRRRRRGRAFRHDLVPPHLPGYVSRRERFDASVQDAMAEMLQRFPRELEYVEVLAEDVPPSSHAHWEDAVLLGRAFPGDRQSPPQIVVYRRPIEMRVTDAEDLRELVRSVLVQNVASLLGKQPEDIDPDFGL
ncbi:metallopeptidase family protein [Helcobacillus massiliensis]|uniref:metallopeptidase family protein n=1 Tax=Helcobacillus massiliensis TaxID=521392 RepID=UPI0025530DD9|nr:metallopeptidase family protein [Helcobacillus massiliensis]MDK7742248.1 metallopeptidase family protein [Helcobacillus massiliensis]WOO93501.1 metallopeptidase family protein [Helcobacillus massiliensis]